MQGPRRWNGRADGQQLHEGVTDVAKPTGAPESVAIPKIRQLRRVEDMVLVARIDCITPVIPHKWSEKALRQMEVKQQSEAGAAQALKEPKNPDQEALDSCYWL